MARLDPKGFVEEIHSFWHFDCKSKTFAFKIIALVDWGQRYMEFGFNYPVPMFPNYVFNWLAESCQVVGQPSLKLDSIQQLGGDVWARCTEAWTLMASVLQFWNDEETIKDGAIFRGCIHPVSTLAEYVVNTINPHLELGYKVTWEEVVCRMPWIRKRLASDNALLKQILHQPIPLEGHSSELEIAMEEYYNLELCRLETLLAGVTKNKPGGSKTITRLGRGQDLKLHLRGSMPGEGWSTVQPKDAGPDVGKRYVLPQSEEPEPQDEPWRRKSDEDTAFLCEEPQQQEGAGRSPLTNELLALGENITELLNYEEDLEVMAAIANLPRVDDVEMRDINAPPGFDPEVGHSRYDHNLVRASDEGALGSNSLVTEREDKMLDEDTQSRALGSG